MLASTKLWLAYHYQAAYTSFRDLFNKPAANLITVVIIAIALTLPGLLWIFSDNLKLLANSWQRQARISLFLKQLTTEEQNHLLVKLKNNNQIFKVIVKTPEQGLKQLQQQEGMQDIMHYLPHNPLPTVIEVIPSVASNAIVLAEQLLHQLQAMPEVDQARLNLQWIKKLQAILNFSAYFSQIIMLLLSTSFIIIIGNTLRLNISQNKETIQILKLIGAQNSFIIRPFLYKGVWYGLIGSLIAIILINVILLSLDKALKPLAQAYELSYTIMGLSVKQAYLLVVSAAFLGWLAALISAKKQLSTIEP